MARIRVEDATAAAMEIAKFALSEEQYKQLKDEEIWAAEEKIADLARSFQPVFARLDSSVRGTVLAVLESIQEEATVRRSRVDVNAFIEYVFQDDVSGKPLKQAAIHRKWHKVMLEQRQSLIIGPRQHGKSTQIIGHCLWRLGNNQNLRIKVISNNDKEASKRILEMQMHIESNERFKRVFPHLVAADRGRWNSERFYVKRTRVMREPSVEGYGVLSGGTGGRCDFMILDDVVDRKNALTQPGLRAAVKEAVRSDWLALLAEGGVVISICTLWHKDDLNCNLGGEALSQWMKYFDGKGEPPKQEGLQAGEWYVSFDAVGEDFTPVWPEAWSKEKLEAIYRQVGRSAFNRGWRNKVVDDSETAIDPNWIRYYPKGKLPPRDELFIIQSYDLAVSMKTKGKKSAFTCCTMAAHFKDDAIYIYILSSFRRKRISFPEQVKTVVAGFDAVKPNVILLEANGYQAALHQQLIDTTILPVVPIMSSIGKALRLESATPAMEAGHILFSEKMNPETGILLEARGDLIGELLDFPFGEDDQVDAFSQGVRYIQEYATTLQSFSDMEYGEANVYMVGDGDQGIEQDEFDITKSLGERIFNA